MQDLKGKHIVLGISGGIAAYKSAALLRLFVKEGAEVQVVMTPSAREFITPVTLSALSGKPVVSEFFTANSGEWHSHVDLGLWADLMIVAPATACTIAKMAAGVADNMLITTYLSAKEPVMVAPAMDLDMYAHPTTKRNLETLRRDGVTVLDSPSGELASGLTGKGRMLEPEQILEEVKIFFERQSGKGPLAGKKVMITAGPTHEKIDAVRYIGNHSSGKMGVALAREMAARGAKVTMVCGPVSESLLENLPLAGIEVERVESAVEMFGAVDNRYDECDVAVFAAAVADYKPVEVKESKIKREKTEELDLKLTMNPDISLEMGKRKRKGQINVGFALETDNGLENAEAKLKRKNLDMIVLNPAGKPDAGFNSDTNRITIISNKTVSDNRNVDLSNDTLNGIRAQELPLLSKRDCAAAIVDAIEKMV